MYQTLKKEINRIQNFAAKQGTRDEMKIRIKDYLWDEKIGLPECVAPEEVEEKTEIVFAHILMGLRITNKGRMFSYKNMVIKGLLQCIFQVSILRTFAYLRIFL